MDRNAIRAALARPCVASLSARRAWIEMAFARYVWAVSGVALRKESVDRNRHGRTPATVRQKVALRKESVDRNGERFERREGEHGSLSARRAWIEMTSE